MSARRSPVPPAASAPPNAVRLKFSDFSILGELSEGQEKAKGGRVVRASREGQDYAIKIFSRSHLTPSLQSHFLFEKNFLFSCRHRGLAKLFHTFSDNQALYFVFQYCPYNGKDFIPANPSSSTGGFLVESEAAHLLASLLNILSFLHGSLHLAHRDLRLENICFDEKGRIKLIDFGESQSLVDSSAEAPESAGASQRNSSEEESGPQEKFSLSGPIDYSPPEIIQQKVCSCSANKNSLDWGAKEVEESVSPSAGAFQTSFSFCSCASHRSLSSADLSFSDLYSCGILLFYLLSGVFPFHGKSEFSTMKRIAQGKIAWRGEEMGFSTETRQLLEILLSHQPDKRAFGAENFDYPKAFQNLPFFKKNNIQWENIERATAPYLNKFKKSLQSTTTATGPRHFKTLNNLDNSGARAVTANSPSILPVKSPIIEPFTVDSTGFRSTSRISLSRTTTSPSPPSMDSLSSSLSSLSPLALSQLSHLLTLEFSALTAAVTALRSEVSLLKFADSQPSPSAFAVAARLPGPLADLDNLRSELDHSEFLLNFSQSRLDYPNILPVIAFPTPFEIFSPLNFPSFSSLLGFSAFRFRVLKHNRLNRNSHRMMEIDFSTRRILSSKYEESSSSSSTAAIAAATVENSGEDEKTSLVRDLLLAESNFVAIRKSAKISNGIELSFMRGEAAAARLAAVGSGTSPSTPSLLTSSPAVIEKVWRLQFFSPDERERFLRLTTTIFRGKTAGTADPLDQFPFEVPMVATKLNNLPIATIAESFHSLWLHEKLQAGWRYGPTDSVPLKINSQLKQYSELNADTRNRYRTLVRRVLGGVLALGFEIPRAAQAAEREEISPTLCQPGAGLLSFAGSLIAKEFFLYYFPLCDSLQQNPTAFSGPWENDKKFLEKQIKQVENILAVLIREGFSITGGGQNSTG